MKIPKPKPVEAPGKAGATVKDIKTELEKMEEGIERLKALQERIRSGLILLTEALEHHSAESPPPARRRNNKEQGQA